MKVRITSQKTPQKAIFDLPKTSPTNDALAETKKMC